MEDPMSTPTVPGAQFVDLGRRGQEAFVDAAQATGAALRAYAELVTPQDARPVDPQAVTSATFDLAQQLLRVQRRYASTAVALLTEAGEAVTAQASAAGQDLKVRTEEATSRVVDLANETTRRAATAARNGVSV
jgi:hypothetical protein